MLIVAAALAPLALAASALPDDGDGEPALVVRDRSGDALLEAPLPASSRFALAYRHSVYGAPARELFSVRADGRLSLTAIESPRAAVLDYYALDGERARRGAWLRLVPARSRTYERVALIATAVGRRTLLVAGERLPLYGGSARHLAIAVEAGS